MFGPDYTAGCPSCSMIADGFNGFAVHLANHDVEQQREGDVEYNYQREPGLEWRAGQEGGGEGAEAKFAAMCGTDRATYQRDRPGMDRAPKGRNETGGVWWRRHDEYDEV